MDVTTMAVIVLALLVITALLGLTSLLRWRSRARSTVPNGNAIAHMTLQVMGIVIWMMFSALGWFGMLGVCIYSTVSL